MTSNRFVFKLTFIPNVLKEMLKIHTAIVFYFEAEDKAYILSMFLNDSPIVTTVRYGGDIMHM